MVYTHEPLAAKTSLTVLLSGFGSPQAADAGGTQGQQGGQEGNSRTESEKYSSGSRAARRSEMAADDRPCRAVCSRRDYALAKASGGAAGPAGELEDAPVAPRKSSAKAAEPAAATGAAPTAATANSVAEVNAQVSARLDSLKETIFRLELRKQAGTISEEEYARERAASKSFCAILSKAKLFGVRRLAAALTA